MFGNIFKKKEKTSLVNEKTTIISSKSYPKEVLEIHHEFETAAEKLLEKANEIINSQPIVNESKINLLKSLGFNQVKELQENSEIIKTINLSKEQINLINYYKKEYPFNKFITEEQVQEICYKYNLICGDVSKFKGFVPEKNLKEISNFKLKKVDDDNPKIGEIYIIMDDWFLLNVKDLKNTNFEYDKKQLNYLINAYLPSHDYSYFGDKSTRKFSNIPGWGKIFQYRNNNINDGDIKKAIERNKKTLQICAPIKDMDITNMTIKNGYKMKENYEDIPDPVVLQPVKKGYLILTAWGDEASDPLIVNENFN